MRNFLTIFFLVGAIYGCAEMVPEPFETSAGHIPAAPEVTQSDIPDIVQQTSLLPEPDAVVEEEKYTVVVNEVPVKELLFALARDAEINIDIHPEITGFVTINAVDQSLQQILNRMSRQVDLRYEIDGDNLIISPDIPFIRSYKVNYISQTREMTGDITLTTSVASGTGQAEGTGQTSVSLTSISDFWGSLQNNIISILGEDAVENDVVVYQETGSVMVRGTSQEHQQVQQLIDDSVETAQRQVLIQVTIAEVTLNQNYQAGIDWSIVNNKGVDLQRIPQPDNVVVGDTTVDPQGQGSALTDVINAQAGFDAVSTALTGAPVDAFSSFVLSYTDPRPDRDQIISATVRLLDEFGDVNVLSTPQVIAMNNQTATMKVVDDIVYFTVETDTDTTQGVATTTINTTPNTVSVGVSMSVTPQINSDESIMLNIRPSISRVLRFVNDPNPLLTVASGVPELRIREFETLLKVNNGQVAVIGGLMENNNSTSDAGTPGISKIPLLGELFKSRTRQYDKTELVVFLRPVIIKNPSIDGDFREYRRYLELTNNQSGVSGNQGQ